MTPGTRRLIAALFVASGVLTQIALAAQAPYTETFDSYPDGSVPANFVETTDMEWAVRRQGTNGFYQGLIGIFSGAKSASSSINLGNVAGQNFTVTTKFFVSSSGSFSQRRINLGLVALGSDPDLSAGSGYQLIYILSGGAGEVGRLLLERNLPPNGQTSTSGPTLGLGNGQNTLTLHGGYVGGTLYLTGTLTNESNATISVRIADENPLIGSNFGYRQYLFTGVNRAATVVASYDDFSVIFETQPVKLANIAARTNVGTSEDVPIAGFIVTGNAPKKIIVRGLGERAWNPTSYLRDPILELHGPDGALLASNDNWKDTHRTEIEATRVAPYYEEDAAIVAILPPGSYTAILRGKADTSGIGLIEVYDLTPGVESRLGNTSMRSKVGLDSNVLIAGVIVRGDEKARVILRARGPSLLASGVSQPLADPTLELRNHYGHLVKTNDNWRDTQQSEIEATSLAPSSDAESAIVADLLPENYTAIVRGKNNTTGVALVEVYHLN